MPQIVNHVKSSQPSLFEARARPTDPQTSQDAAASVTNISRLQELILAAFRIHGEMTDTTLSHRLAGYGHHLSPSGVRSRRAELVASSNLRNTGRTMTLASGRKSIIWEISA